MKKFILPTLFGILLIATAVLNVINWNDEKLTKEKLALFEKQKYTLTIYTKTGAQESQILILKNLLEGQSSVQSVKYISAEQVLADFKKEKATDEVFLQALNKLDTNSLNARLEITMSDPAHKLSLINFIQSNDKNSIVDRINL